MNFQTFQSHCRHAQYGLKEGYSGVFELTCRKPDCIPKGHSWGICDEAHCPHFGMTIESGAMIDKETGTVLFTFKGGRIILGK